MSTQAVRVLLPQAGKSLFDYTLPAAPLSRGQLVQVPIGRRIEVGVVWELGVAAEVPAERLKPLAAVWADWPPIEAALLDQIAFASRYYLSEPGEFLATVLPAALRRRRHPPRWAALLASWRAGCGEGRAAGEGDARQGTADTADDSAPWLTPAQAAAWAEMGLTFERFEPVLLHGVTGSGKTELYWRVVEAAVGRGRQVLLLVPEIGLVPQTVARLTERFPGLPYAVIHSDQGERTRQEAFAALVAGEPAVVVGTRSAIFAPLPQLGAIVVDEEHDPSYAQFEGVPYSARDLALWRGKRCGVPVVLGSATPSLARWHDAARGRLRRVAITERVSGRPLPAVELVPVTRTTPLVEGLALPVWEAIGETLAAGEQVLLFLNRRGFAPVLFCPHCGWRDECRRCSVRLVYHRVDQRMRCHHCGWSEPVPTACPACGSVAIEVAGRGTQRLEAALAARFPEVPCVRIDRDAVPGSKAFADVRAEIASGGVPLLIGTQMLAKGHDFPHLSLVVVVEADAGLLSSQWQAGERWMQQLMQVAGRAGRAERSGRVLIQTRYPDHPFFAALLRHDYAAFAEALLAERRQLQLPPFVHQAVLRADAPRLAPVLAFLAAAREAAATLIAKRGWSAVRLFDVVPLRITRLAGRERAQLLVESPIREQLRAFLEAWQGWLTTHPCPRALRWRLWVEPEEG